MKTACSLSLLNSRTDPGSFARLTQKETAWEIFQAELREKGVSSSSLNRIYQDPLLLEVDCSLTTEEEFRMEHTQNGSMALSSHTGHTVILSIAHPTLLPPILIYPL